MADAPLFYLPQILHEREELTLPDETARHVAQVLRMQSGERILLTNGEGLLAECVLSSVGKKHVDVSIHQVEKLPEPDPLLHLIIAFTKNASRNEWLLEKATELGVRRITPLITARANREHIRHERWQAILVSAMLQSKQCWLPLLDAPLAFAAAINSEAPQKLIAHCIADAVPRIPVIQALAAGKDTRILIGPEGDFTPAEVTLAMDAGAVPVSLGTNRLRTETAALAAITHFYLINHAV